MNEIEIFEGTPFPAEALPPVMRDVVVGTCRMTSPFYASAANAALSVASLACDHLAAPCCDAAHLTLGTVDVVNSWMRDYILRSRIQNAIDWPLYNHASFMNPAPKASFYRTIRRLPEGRPVYVEKTSCVGNLNYLAHLHTQVGWPDTQVGHWNPCSARLVMMSDQFKKICGSRPATASQLHLLPRFLFAAMPTPIKGRFFYEEGEWSTIDEQAAPQLMAWRDRIDALFQMNPSSGDRRSPGRMLPDPSAQQRIRHFDHHMVDAINKQNSYIKEIGSYANGILLDMPIKLATIFQVIEHGPDTEITEENAQRGQKIAAWYCAEAHRLVRLVTAGKKTVDMHVAA